MIKCFKSLASGVLLLELKLAGYKICSGHSSCKWISLFPCFVMKLKHVKVSKKTDHLWEVSWTLFEESFQPQCRWRLCHQEEKCFKSVNDQSLFRCFLKRIWCNKNKKQSSMYRPKNTKVWILTGMWPVCSITWMWWQVTSVCVCFVLHTVISAHHNTQLLITRRQSDNLALDRALLLDAGVR